ncbi:MAG: XRE family transcriptional regulator [Bacteroidota bacterium]
MNHENKYPIHRIGPKIREMRKKQGIKLGDLAEASGMSNALLSKIENGRVVPTLTKLLDVMQVLSVTPEDFFKEITAATHLSVHTLIKKEAYVGYVKEESAKGFEYKSILDKTLLDLAFQVSHVRLEPNNQRPKVCTDAFEFLYVLQGEIEYKIGDETIIIQEGDSFFFDGMLPHVPLNKTKSPVEYLVVYFFTERMAQN